MLIAIWIPNYVTRKTIAVKYENRRANNIPWPNGLLRMDSRDCCLATSFITDLIRRRQNTKKAVWMAVKANLPILSIKLLFTRQATVHPTQSP